MNNSIYNARGFRMNALNMVSIKTNNSCQPANHWIAKRANNLNGSTFESR